LVEAALYRAELVGPIVAASETEEILWLDPSPPYATELAPLTRDIVIPLARSFTHARLMRGPNPLPEPSGHGPVELTAIF